MSTDRSLAPTVDDRDAACDGGDQDADHDPYDVVPEGFCDAYDAETIPEALRKAEQAASRTPEDEMRRCPEGGSVRIRIKVGAVEQAHERPESYKCTHCGAHFDTPAPSRDDAAPGEQATLGELQR